MLQQNTSKRIIRKDFSQEKEIDIQQKLAAKIRMYLQTFSALPPTWPGRTYDAGHPKMKLRLRFKVMKIQGSSIEHWEGLQAREPKPH